MPDRWYLAAGSVSEGGYKGARQTDPRSLFGVVATAFCIPVICAFEAKLLKRSQRLVVGRDLLRVGWLEGEEVEVRGANGFGMQVVCVPRDTPTLKRARELQFRAAQWSLRCLILLLRILVYIRAHRPSACSIRERYLETVCH